MQQKGEGDHGSNGTDVIDTTTGGDGGGSSESQIEQITKPQLVCLIVDVQTVSEKVCPYK